MRSARNIINNLKEHLGIETDRELAEFIGIKPGALAGQIMRDSLDLNHLVKVLVDIDLNWLIRGQSLKDDNGPDRTCPELEKEIEKLEVKLEAYREIIRDISQGKGPAPFTLTPSQEPVKSS